MQEPDYSIFIGADGEEGLIQLVQMLRFDIQMQVYMVAVLMTDDGTFDVNVSTNPEDGKIHYTRRRLISLRQEHKNYKTYIYYSEETNRYYINVASIAPYLRDQTKRLLKYNINGKYGNYFLENIDGRTLLVKGLSE